MTGECQENLLKNFRRNTHGFWLPHTDSIDAPVVGRRLGRIQRRRSCSQTSWENVEQASLGSRGIGLRFDRSLFSQPTVSWNTKQSAYLCIGSTRRSADVERYQFTTTERLGTAERKVRFVYSHLLRICLLTAIPIFDQHIPAENMRQSKKCISWKQAEKLRILTRRESRSNCQSLIPISLDRLCFFPDRAAFYFTPHPFPVDLALGTWE